MVWESRILISSQKKDGGKIVLPTQLYPSTNRRKIMGSRPTDAEVLAKLDAADGPVTHVLLKDVCVSRLRDAVEREAAKDAEIERLEAELQKCRDAHAL